MFSITIDKYFEQLTSYKFLLNSYFFKYPFIIVLSISQIALP